MSTVRPAQASPSFQYEDRRIRQGTDARSAPTSPSNRMPVVDRTKADPQIVKAAEGMEAVFLDQMMSEMRKSVPDSELSPKSKATEIYQGMLDSEYSKTAARTGGIGLADLIIAYLDAGQYTHGRSAPAAPPGQGTGQQSQDGAETRIHGGTDEGR